MQEQSSECGFHVQADSLHRLYVEEHGSPTGIPVVVLHGGPGAGMSRKQIETFDPSAFRIIIFDQRGAGQSTPHAELRNNATPDLIADIEILRANLGIESWLVCGGSWGSCLALAYAQAHPDRCLGLRLHGIFLAGRDTRTSWR